MLAILPLPPILAPTRFLIVPGVSVGRIHVGESLDEVTKAIGKPKDGDAAMGHFWSTWTSKAGSRVDVYSTRNADGDQSLVRIIRVTSKSFHLANGDHTGYSLRVFRKEFPGARLRGSYPVSGLGKVQLWDDRKRGIAFEGLKEMCVAIAVHKKGSRVDQSYLPYIGTVPEGR